MIDCFCRMPRKKHDMTSSQRTTKAVPTAPSSSPHIKTKHGQSLSVADSQIDKNKTKKTSQEMKTLDKSHKNGDEIDDLFGALKHTKKRETPSFSGKVGFCSSFRKNDSSWMMIIMYHDIASLAMSKGIACVFVLVYIYACIIAL